jgi:DNA ligase-1
MDAFAAACESIASTSSRLEKVRLAAEYLKTLDDESIGIGACFLSGLAFSRVDPRRARAGHALVMRAATSLTGWDAHIIGACGRAAGDMSEAIGLLAVDHPPEGLASVCDARNVFDALARASSQERKLEILLDALRRLTPRGVKYFLKLLVGGLRIGLLEKQVEEAIALATGRTKEEVGDARVRSGDVELVARSARAGTLASVEANLFHPVDFMLASPVLTAHDVEAPETYLIERKLDGIRAQAHIGGGRVVLFSRGMGDVTSAFPEIVSALRGVRGPVVMDGELLAMEGERALPFLLLQRRLSRKAPSAELLAEIQVCFVGYDLIHDPEGLLFDLPIEERQSRLGAIITEISSPKIRLSKAVVVPDVASIERLFEEARDAGDEGLVLKKRGSVYEPGKRGQTWLKLKRALGTLDVVITGAEQGHGQRASMLSDYTFAVRDGDQYVNVGKAYSGLTDEEIRSLTRRLQELTLERFGRVRLMRPEIVLEVAFDVVQKSNRHKSGYALRFPRIVRLRPDKLPHEVDTLERVRQLYEATINTGRVAPKPPPPAPPPRGSVDDLPLFARVQRSDPKPP